jgi:phosphoglucosamine mutase
VAFLTRSLRADLGVMISASHNPYQDNGIKLFGPDGFKLSDELELEIEALMANGCDKDLAAPEDLGRAQRMEDARGRYVENLKSSFPRGRTLQGLKIVVDAANGAAYHLAADLFWELGADVVRIGASPDGRNINDRCGSTCPETVAQTVVKEHADLGVALDGDADRVILVDEHGRVIDGDQLIGLIARSWRDSGLLRGQEVAATLMSNLGLERHLKGLGLGLWRTKVGDRYVVEAMRQRGLNLGGEQSGHIILTDYATTGDGLLAALQILSVVVDADRPLSEVANVFTPVPQRLVNLPAVRGLDLAGGLLGETLAGQRQRLGDRGRLLVRPSGTEAVLRVMVEAEDPGLLEDVLGVVSSAIETAGRSAAWREGARPAA